MLSCTISPQSSFAAENGTAAIYHLGSQAAGNETALSQSGNGLAPIGVKQADEEMEQRYAKREDNQISPQSYVSEYQIYSEIERRVKDAMLSGQTTVDISDMNIYETKCVFPYYYGYSPYFPEGSFVALYYAEDEEKSQSVRRHQDDYLKQRRQFSGRTVASFEQGRL